MALMAGIGADRTPPKQVVSHFPFLLLAQRSLSAIRSIAIGLAAPDRLCGCPREASSIRAMRFCNTNIVL